MVKIFLKPNIHKPKSQASKTYHEATLFPILPIDKLLPELEKSHYLNKIQEIVSLPDDYFNEFYESLIDNFALFVQTLPEFYGEELGGLLNDGLRRSLLAIQILKENHETTPHPLLFFAIFSIALLSDIGQVLQYRIIISDENGVFINEWSPHLGPMSDFGDFYKLRPYEGTPQSLIYNVTPLLARQLLNETAMTWLTSNNQIFDMWLAFLLKSEDWTGGLGKILRIDLKQFETRKDAIGLFPVDIHLHDPKTTELGEKFLAWLRQGLEDGTISFNEADSKVHVVKVNELDISVFLQAPELFQQFTNIYAKTQNWIVTCKQFNFLGFTKLSGYDVKFEQFFADSPDVKVGKLGFLSREKMNRKASALNTKEGLVVKDAKMLFGSKVPPPSQYLQDIEMRWGLDNVLPKLKEAPPEVKPGPKMKI